MHRWLARQAGTPQRGHDAIVLARARGRSVVCCDQTIEGVHCAPGTPPLRIGFKAAARALSDLAATAAHPLALLAGLHAPAEREERWLRGVLSGVRRCAAELGCELVGGDLAASPGPAALCVSAIGEFRGQGRAPHRARARAGQRVLLTGAVGGSSLGRHLAIRPRLEAGRWLYSAGATALMDVSDGLALDLFRLARSSGVRIDLEQIPVHRDARRLARKRGTDPRWHALHDGEDHELIATLSAAAARRALAEGPRRCPELSQVGRVRSGSGLWVRAQDGRWQRWSQLSGGYQHGEARP